MLAVLFVVAAPLTLLLTHRLPAARGLVAGVEGPPPTDADRDGDGLDDAAEDALLVRFAPTALVAKDDPSLPASIEWLRAREALSLEGPRVFGALVPGRQFADKTRRGSTHEGDWVVYGHVYPAADGGTVIQYWFYFPYNAAPFAPLFDHESDWEHVSVIVGADGRPHTFALARHDQNAPGVRVPWERVVKTGDHPWFAIAAGTHAAYLDRDEAPFWEAVPECPRTPDGTPVVSGCEAYAWRAGESGRSPLVNVGERDQPRVAFGTDGFLMRYAGLWGAVGSASVGSAGPAGPPFQRGFCADARPGACR